MFKKGPDFIFEISVIRYIRVDCIWTKKQQIIAETDTIYLEATEQNVVRAYYIFELTVLRQVQLKILPSTSRTSCSSHRH